MYYTFFKFMYYNYILYVFAVKFLELKKNGHQMSKRTTVFDEPTLVWYSLTQCIFKLVYYDAHYDDCLYNIRE